MPVALLLTTTELAITLSIAGILLLALIVGLSVGLSRRAKMMQQRKAKQDPVIKKEVGKADQYVIVDAQHRADPAITDALGQPLDEWMQNIGMTSEEIAQHWEALATFAAQEIDPSDLQSLFPPPANEPLILTSAKVCMRASLQGNLLTKEAIKEMTKSVIHLYKDGNTNPRAIAVLSRSQCIAIRKKAYAYMVDKIKSSKINKRRQAFHAIVACLPKPHPLTAEKAAVLMWAPDPMWDEPLPLFRYISGENDLKLCTLPPAFIMEVALFYHQMQTAPATEATATLTQETHSSPAACLVKMQLLPDRLKTEEIEKIMNDQLSEALNGWAEGIRENGTAPNYDDDSLDKDIFSFAGANFSCDTFIKWVTDPDSAYLRHQGIMVLSGYGDSKDHITPFKSALSQMLTDPESDKKRTEDEKFFLVETCRTTLEVDEFLALTKKALSAEGLTNTLKQKMLCKLNPHSLGPLYFDETHVPTVVELLLNGLESGIHINRQRQIIWSISYGNPTARAMILSRWKIMLTGATTKDQTRFFRELTSCRGNMPTESQGLLPEIKRIQGELSAAGKRTHEQDELREAAGEALTKIQGL